MAVLSPENMYYWDVLDDITGIYLGPTPYRYLKDLISCHRTFLWQKKEPLDTFLQKEERSYQGRVSKNGI